MTDVWTARDRAGAVYHQVKEIVSISQPPAPERRVVWCVCKRSSRRGKLLAENEAVANGMRPCPRCWSDRGAVSGNLLARVVIFLALAVLVGLFGWLDSKEMPR